MRHSSSVFLALVPSSLVFLALLACKAESRQSDPAPIGSASSPATAAEAPQTALDKRGVCGLFGKDSDSERCSDCMDDAELGSACSRKADSWENCAGDVEKLAGKCAGECVNDCVKGQKGCCECTADCVARQKPECVQRFLGFQRCTVEECKKQCS